MKKLIKDMKANENITTYLALESMHIRKSKTNKDYLVLCLSDRTGKIKGYLWNNPVEMAAILKKSPFVKVNGITKILNGILIINLDNIRVAEKNGINISDFKEVIPSGIVPWYKKPLELIALIGRVRIVEELLILSLKTIFY